MRAMFGVLGLLLALGIAALVVKKQLESTQHASPLLAAPAAIDGDSAVAKPAATVPQQSQQIQQQYQQAMESALQ